MPVADLANSEVVALSDVVEFSNTSNQMVSVRCNGRYEGGHCRIHFLFSLSDNRPKRIIGVRTTTHIVLPSK